MLLFLKNRQNCNKLRLIRLNEGERQPVQANSLETFGIGKWDPKDQLGIHQTNNAVGTSYGHLTHSFFFFMSLTKRLLIPNTYFSD